MLRSFFGRRKRRPFSAWQIELTTRCPLRCAMCVKEEYQDQPRRDMAIDDFKRIVPYLKNVESVVLEGWGESLLHKHLIECVELIEGQGARAGFVTCGMLLDEGYMERLIRAGLDFIGFSLSGATAETHNKIRVNSDFDKLIDSIKRFRGLVLKQGLKKPKMHIVYLMLKDNMHEVPAIIELAKEIDIEEVVLINIAQITNVRQDTLKAFSYDNEEPYRDILKKAEATAVRSKIRLTKSALSPCETAVCSENPLRNLYISVDGEVSPCVYLQPPAPSPFKRYFHGEEYDIQKLSFGNIFREPFEIIWDKKEYVEFRECFIRRKQAAEETYKSLLSLKKPDTLISQNPPDPCKTCHKMLGV